MDYADATGGGLNYRTAECRQKKAPFIFLHNASAHYCCCSSRSGGRRKMGIGPSYAFCSTDDEVCRKKLLSLVRLSSRKGRRALDSLDWLFPRPSVLRCQSISLSDSLSSSGSDSMCVRCYQACPPGNAENRTNETGVYLNAIAMSCSIAVSILASLNHRSLKVLVECVCISHLYNTKGVIETYVLYFLCPKFNVTKARFSFVKPGRLFHLGHPITLEPDRS